MDEVIPKLIKCTFKSLDIRDVSSYINLIQVIVNLNVVVFEREIGYMIYLVYDLIDAHGLLHAIVSEQSLSSHYFLDIDQIFYNQS